MDDPPPLPVIHLESNEAMRTGSGGQGGEGGGGQEGQEGRLNEAAYMKKPPGQPFLFLSGYSKRHLAFSTHTFFCKTRSLSIMVL